MSGDHFDDKVDNHSPEGMEDEGEPVHEPVYRRHFSCKRAVSPLFQYSLSSFFFSLMLFFDICFAHVAQLFQFSFDIRFCKVDFFHDYLSSATS